MKNILATCFLLIMGLAVEARSEDLGVVETIAEGYYLLGDGNNYLETTIFPSFFLESFKARGKATKVTDAALVEAIKECVFMTQGVYGEFLNPDLQDRLANRFGTMLSSLSSYRIDAQDFTLGIGTVNAPCVLAVEDSAADQVLCMQGVAND